MLTPRDSPPQEFFRDDLCPFACWDAGRLRPALCHDRGTGRRQGLVQYHGPGRLDHVSGQGITRSAQPIRDTGRLPQPDLRRTARHELLGRHQPAAGGRAIRPDLLGSARPQDRQARPRARRQRGPRTHQAQDTRGLRIRPAPPVPQGPLRLRHDRHLQHRRTAARKPRISVPRAAGRTAPLRSQERADPGRVALGRTQRRLPAIRPRRVSLHRHRRQQWHRRPLPHRPGPHQPLGCHPPHRRRPPRREAPLHRAPRQPLSEDPGRTPRDLGLRAQAAVEDELRHGHRRPLDRQHRPGPLGNGLPDQTRRQLRLEHHRGVAPVRARTTPRPDRDRASDHRT